jgi:hypothetical protein
MPLRLNVGISKKLGLPEYSSIGASCNLELELSEALLHSDLATFHEQVRDVYIACTQAVNDELARHQASPAPPPSNGHSTPASGHAPGDGNGQTAPRTNGARGRSRKPATPSQVRAIVAIARAQHADLEGILRAEYAVARPEDLALSEASQLIDQLKAAAQA